MEKSNERSEWKGNDYERREKKHFVAHVKHMLKRQNISYHM
jgi:hypothetical protein